MPKCPPKKTLLILSAISLSWGPKRTLVAGGRFFSYGFFPLFKEPADSSLAPSLPLPRSGVVEIVIFYPVET